MKIKTRGALNFLTAALVCMLSFTAAIAQIVDPLPSWNEGKSK